jgi:hypothetical protein
VWWELGRTIAFTGSGGYDAQPVPGDYMGLGTSQLALYRPSVGTWAIDEVARKSNPVGPALMVSWERGRRLGIGNMGTLGDIPVQPATGGRPVPFLP